MTDTSGILCNDDRLQALAGALSTDETTGLQLLEHAITEFPEDARLHFLRGSVLIGMRRFVGAHKALVRAVEIAPDFHLARFQLGFFELTSGEIEAALDSWKPLDVLGQQHWISHFVAGLKALVRDDFVECARLLETGISLNTENLPLNKDMQLIIDQCREILKSDARSGGAAPVTDDAYSETSFLLGLGRRH